MAYTRDEDGNLVVDTSQPPTTGPANPGAIGINFLPEHNTTPENIYRPGGDAFGLGDVLRSLLPGGTTPSEALSQWQNNGGPLGSLLPGGITPQDATARAVGNMDFGNVLGALLGFGTGGLMGGIRGAGRDMTPGQGAVGSAGSELFNNLGWQIAGAGSGNGAGLQPGTTDYTDFYRNLGANGGSGSGGDFDVTGLPNTGTGAPGTPGGGGAIPPEVLALMGPYAGRAGGTVNIPGLGDINLGSILGAGGGLGTGARQGGGRGGGPAGSGAASSANTFLQGIFGDPNSSNFNPNIQAQIEALLPLQQGRTDQFLELAMGANNPILQAILGDGAGSYNGSFSGVPGGATGISAPDIQLRDLPPEVMATIQQRFDADKGLLDLQRAEQNDQLTAQLFGRGVQRSTVAQDAAGRLAFGQDEALANLMAGRDDRILGLQESDAERRSRLAQTEMSANAQLGAARASAGASLAAAQTSARMSALRGIFGDQMGFLSNALSSNNQFLGGFANTLSGIGQAELGSQNNLANTAQNVLQSQDHLAAARAAAAASRYATSTGAQTAQQQLALQAILGIGGLNLDQQRIDNQLLLGREGNDLTQQQINANTPSNTDRAIQVAAILASLYGNRG